MEKPPHQIIYVDRNNIQVVEEMPEYRDYQTFSTVERLLIHSGGYRVKVTAARGSNTIQFNRLYHTDIIDNKSLTGLWELVLSTIILDYKIAALYTDAFNDNRLIKDPP